MSKYDSSSIVSLSDIESIRVTPSMYIGNTQDPTHLLFEVLDNSLDEVLGGFANIVAIGIDTKNKIYTCVDNGRGIPIDNDTPVKISTELFTGAKFKGMKKSYQTATTGRHGVGLVAVNALSDFMNILVFRDKQYGYFGFENCQLVNKITEPSELNPIPYSTKVEFKPSKKIFESLDVNVEKIRSRLLVSSAHLPKCTFVLVVDGKKEVIRISEDEYFKNHCTLGEQVTDEVCNVIVMGSTKLAIKFCYSNTGSISPRVLSCVNLLPTEEGGTHVNYFLDILKEFFSQSGKKLKKAFTPQDSLCGLRVFISLFLDEAEFGGQTKGKLTNRKTHLQDIFEKYKRFLDSYFRQRPDYLDRLLNKFQDYRRSQESKKVTSKTKSTGIRSTKLKDCKRRDGELILVEGDSAAGGFINCRDVNIHAIMPLKGVPPSVVNKKDKILENNEVGEIVRAIGTGVGPNFDISRLRYDKIILAADADPDGSHIVSLLILLFAVLMPEIILQGKLFVCETPLYGITKGKTFTPIWTQETLELARQKNEVITRFKGLGEFNPWQLRICALDSKNRKLVKVEYTKNLDKIIKLFSNSDEKRKLLEGKFEL